MFPPATEQRLRDYAALLHTWTRRINLVSAADQPNIWSRHVLDSLRLAPLLPAGTERGIDLGSGAGFPGLVLAIATGIPFDLIESDQRKAAFLREAARLTAAPVTIHTTRIEDTPIPPAPVVTARALAPLDKLLPMAARHLAAGGTMIFPKGTRAAEEVAAARRLWTFRLAIEGGASPILLIRDPAPIPAQAQAQARHADALHTDALHTDASHTND